MPGYEARKFALDLYHKAIDEAVHLAFDAETFPLRFCDLEHAFADAPAFDGCFEDDVKAAAQAVYLKCKSWVEYQRLHNAPATTTAKTADDDDDDDDDDDELE